jgi:Transposase
MECTPPEHHLQHAIASTPAQPSDARLVSSLSTAVKRIAKHVRSHCRVENSSHSSLDATFGEDKSRLRRGNSPEIAAVLRRTALTVLKQDTTVKKLDSRQETADWLEYQRPALNSYRESRCIR